MFRKHILWKCILIILVIIIGTFAFAYFIQWAYMTDIKEAVERQEQCRQQKVSKVDELYPSLLQYVRDNKPTRDEYGKSHFVYYLIFGDEEDFVDPADEIRLLEEELGNYKDVDRRSALEQIFSSDPSIPLWKRSGIELARSGVDQKVIPIFIENLNHPSKCNASFEALCELDNIALSYMKDALHNSDKEIRYRVLLLIKERNDIQLIPELKKLLQNDKDPWTRLITAYVLGEIGNKDLIPFFQEVKNDQNTLVREMVTVQQSRLENTKR